MADALIGIGIDLSEVVKAAGQLASTVEGDTEKALREIQRQAIKSAKNIEKAIKAQAREQKKAAREAERAARRAAAEAERQAQEAREAAKGLAELAGISADKFDKARAVMAGLSTPLGQAAVAGTAAALAVAGFAAAVVGATVAAVSLTRTADDLIDELQPLHDVLQIDAAAVASIEAANTALDGAAAAGQALVVQLAERLAPTVERTAFIIVKLGLAAGDALSSMGSGAKVVGDVFGAMGRAVLRGLSAPLGTLLDFVETTKVIARATGFDELADRIDSLQRPLRDLPLQAVEVAFEGVEAATGDYDARAKELLGTVAELRKEQKRKTDATRQATEADRAAAEAAKAAEAAFKTYEQALAAARAPFVDQSEIAKLQRLQEALIVAASDATLTASQVDELSAALEQVAGRIDAVRREQAEAFEQEQVAAATAALEDYERALDAARAPFVDRSEIAQLGRLREALLATASEATLTAEQVQQLDGALADIDDRIATISAEEIDFGDSAQRSADALSKAGEAFSIATGGTLDALTGIASAVQVIGEADTKKEARQAARAMADEAATFIENLAANIGPFIQALAAGIPDIITALLNAVPKIFVEIIKNGPRIGVAIVKGIVLAIPELIRTIVRLVRRNVEQALRVGQRVRRRFSDTPGPVRVNRETQVSVAPGDYVVAARTMQGLRAQTGGSASASTSSTNVAATMVIDFRDGPARLGVERATARAVDRRAIGRNTTGRARVY
jgi:hypothetical protein